MVHGDAKLASSPMNIQDIDNLILSNLRQIIQRSKASWMLEHTTYTETLVRNVIYLICIF